MKHNILFMFEKISITYFVNQISVETFKALPKVICFFSSWQSLQKVVGSCARKVLKFLNFILILLQIFGFSAAVIKKIKVFWEQCSEFETHLRDFCERRA